jgi:hypothetical protein
MFVSLQNSFVEILPLGMILLGGGTFQKSLSHKNAVLMNGISVIMEGSPLPVMWAYNEGLFFCTPELLLSQIVLSETI